MKSGWENIEEIKMICIHDGILTKIYIFRWLYFYQKKFKVRYTHLHRWYIAIVLKKKNFKKYDKFLKIKAKSIP